MAPARSDRFLVLFGLTLSSLAAFQLFKLPPILPLLLERFAYDRTLAGAFMSVYALAGLLFSLAAARSLQRGATASILAALLAFALGNLAIWLWPSQGWTVLAARFVEGLGFAVLAVAGPSLATANASARALPLVIGLTAAWMPIGQLLAWGVAQPALHLDAWWLLPLAGLATAAAVAGWTCRAAPALQRTATAGTGAAVATARESVSLTLTSVVFLVFSGQYFAFMTWLPQYLVEALDLSLAQAQLGYLLPVVVLLTWNLLGGLLLRRRAWLGWLLQAGLAAMAVGWFLLPRLGADVGGIAALIGYGIGAGLAPTCLFAMPAAILGPERPLTAAFARLMTGRNFGVLVGPPLLAEVSKQADGWALAAPLFGAATLAATGLALWLTLRLPPPQGTRR